jgi:uncharacterized protein (TIRG00374 family)
MSKYRRFIVIGILLGLLAFIGIALISDASQLARYVTTFPWHLMALALGLRVVNWALRFLKWHFYLWLVGVRNIRLAESAAIFVTGFPLSVSPGKAAEILKSFILKNMTGASVAATLPVVVAERLSDGMAVLLLCGWAMLNLSAEHNYWPVVGTAMAFLVAGTVILQIRPLCRALLRALSHAPLIGRFARGFELFYESSYRIVQLPNLILAVGVGFFANALDGLGVYLILVGLGLPPTADTFFHALLAISLSVVAGSLSGAPGGVGASDLTIAGTLRALFGEAFSAAQAGFATLLATFIQRWWGCGGRCGGIPGPSRLFPPELEQTIRAPGAAHTGMGDRPPSGPAGGRPGRDIRLTAMQPGSQTRRAHFHILLKIQDRGLNLSGICLTFPPFTMSLRIVGAPA